ncbi:MULTISPECIES: FAD-dependent oxidoreductase [unclassified Pseudomonas]|jgi:monoamine oxidase|uniref:Amine oxidase n=1 Tax=Pseudomonas gorinensis TaxID=3240790 RepID=A0ACA7P4D3_9PSED|nr:MULTISPECIES: FAD-dependent oxidoreductase [unclassified Pseudomonas]AHC34785.1 amine oxidase [Pseudomonas sp. TKP]MBL1306280.1 FAD-dependent oxidoreductase [Pseudomonas sp.]PMX14344.1 FAD-dependent oxidoreductase [Pseudomonas sp. MPBC4-3]PMX46715.1 FAD-dependent oxidoreductase [Pseudomonas sp. FW301-21B01]PMY04289.1 FAD-dependent oxidoreductase [Pseudomonas sp. MPR-R5A]
MTIGSDFNYPADIATKLHRKKRSSKSKWTATFPNPPDLCFDYRTLLEQKNGVAQATEPRHKICVIGAGITGLTTARELHRCGFTHITLIEKSTRIGGRHLTALGSNNTNTLGRPPFEMGAMRMPFFNKSNEQPKDGRSLMAYYANEFELAHSNFPNPGSPWVRSTGIYLQEGCIDDNDQPIMLIWKNTDGRTPPPGKTLGVVFAKWTAFAEHMTSTIAHYYGTDKWEDYWAAIVKRYEGITFRDLVKTPTINAWNANDPGNFGGMGMTAEESAIFYSIGIGDGSWGAFYDICSLYPIRTAIFGFSSHLQLIHGRVNPDGTPIPSPYLNAPEVVDSKGLKFNKPHYIGLASLAESLLFIKPTETQESLYEHLIKRESGLLTSSSVTKLEKLKNGQIRVHYTWHPIQSKITNSYFIDFDSVVMTLPSWIIETQILLENFNQDMLPFEIIAAYKTAHWETSCKVYAPLKKTFLSNNKNIPQAIVTDSFIHDVYTYRYNENSTYDCILLSYTWEDDATKLSSFSDNELVEKCIKELDRILLKSTNIKERISPYIGHKQALVQRWMKDKHSLGCAKLYRAGTYYDAVSLMKYNRDFSYTSGLYLCGESFSVDAGWTEPCFRGAIDTVINICNKTHANFNGDFTMQDYPEYINKN